MTLEMLAYAKLNISLRVHSRRADGYHEIDSRVQTVDLSDRVSVTRQRSGIVVENDLPGLVGSDIAQEAAEGVLAAKRASGGARIRIRKGIPAGAGLGGGSSDAAAVLWAVDQLTPPRLQAERLHELALDIGSDVPLFLVGGQIRVTGRGEFVERLGASREEHFVLLVPPVHCETRTVYRACRPIGAGERPEKLGANDLLEPAISTYPDLVEYRDAILQFDASYTGMSGSGSTFYAAFAERQGACDAKAELDARFPQARSFVCASTDAGHRLFRGGME